ncbi:MAG: hypothetical protein ACRDLM_11795 [Gaiellaceae bacterium]
MSAPLRTARTYLISADGAAVRPVFVPFPSTPLGWTSDGLARVKLLVSTEGKAHTRFRPGVYLLTLAGRVVRQERRLPASPGC